MNVNIFGRFVAAIGALGIIFSSVLFIRAPDIDNIHDIVKYQSTEAKMGFISDRVRQTELQASAREKAYWVGAGAAAVLLLGFGLISAGNKPRELQESPKGQ